MREREGEEEIEREAEGDGWKMNGGGGEEDSILATAEVICHLTWKE